MKDFFKFMFASMLGFFLTSVILFFLFFAFIMAIVSFTQPKDVEVNEKSLLHLKLNYQIHDKSANDPFNLMMDFKSFKPKPGLNEILKNIDKAKDDEKIKGIYLDLQSVPSGLATITEIRKAILDFKSSGKFVFSYGDIYSQKAYFLASVSDKVFLNPEGIIDFRGFNANVMFIKGLLEKLEIDPQIIRHGKYKSAIEPLILDKMSEANKEQTLRFLQSMWDNSISEIAGSRNIDMEALNIIADELKVQMPDDALNLNIVDSLLYYDQFLELIAKKLDIEYVKKENLISVNKYNNSKGSGDIKKRSKNKVAVIYASGDIMQGEGEQDVIGADKVARILRNARLDEDIKAVVFRVNSPGGDALASDIILREVLLTHKEKPVVVSMGNLAASGGYYIACGADKIVASPNTITGSIGVFGVIPNFKGFFNNKLGITFDNVKTNSNADFISISKPLSEFQYEIIHKQVEDIYSTFVNHVATGRNMTFEQVDEIGQGRVWSGSDALELGLVDKLGGLDDAVNIAVELAGLEDFRKVEYPKKKDPFEQIIQDLFGETKTKVLERELGENYIYYKNIKKLSRISGVQARLPFEIEIE